jgi:deoxyribodipyrimidine photolyase-related protein
MWYHPHQILRWFWEQYADAFEWVVVPNVLAMSQMSDGGRLATKPYISGGNYIHKMSNFCESCVYSVKKKTCPMTPLYWDFVDRNREMYKKWRSPYTVSQADRLDLDAIRDQKAYFLQKYQSKVL